MSKQHKDPRLETLKEGKSYTWTVSEGGKECVGLASEIFVLFEYSTEE